MSNHKRNKCAKKPRTTETQLHANDSSQAVVKEDQQGATKLTCAILESLPWDDLIQNELGGKVRGQLVI